MNSNITGFKRQRNSEDESLPLGKRQLDGIPCMNRVLLVDEETASRVWMQAMLASLSIETIPVYSAQHAIHELETHHRGHFDFIFIDFDLSSNNALKLVRWIHSMAVQSKIVGMYTNDDTERKRMFYDAGATVCVKKSMDPASVSQIIGYLRNM